MKTNLTVCPDCDLLIQHAVLADRHLARCPRCDAKVGQFDSQFIQKSFAYSLAGLLFYFPANFLPLLRFDIFGLGTTNTMLNGVIQLFHSGYYWMSILVLLCSVIIPLCYLLMVLYCCVSAHFHHFNHTFQTVLLWQDKLKEWAMLDVYLLGILIAYIKMGDMGHIATDMGLYCFLGLMLSFILTQATFNTASAFDYMETINAKRAST